MTTHLGSLKLLQGTVPGVVNGSLEIDPAAMTPTFRFIRGVPGASHALAMAERLGLDRALIERARSYARAETVTLERVLQDLQTLRRTLDAELERLAAARAAAEAAERHHREAAEQARLELDQVTRRLTRESEALTARARELRQLDDPEPPEQARAHRSGRGKAAAARARGEAAGRGAGAARALRSRRDGAAGSGFARYGSR